ncbi:MAG TPA: hypothetical protein VF846_06425, partial [Thermoanaerobaculia bacterium]
MLGLILAAVLDVQASVVIESLQPRHTFELAERKVGYARDTQYEYLATSNGLYRAQRLAAGPLELMPAAGAPLNGAGVDADGALYVFRGLSWHAHWDAPTLLRSMDAGVTFDASPSTGLLDCSLAPQYPCGYVVPTRISFGHDRIFLVASDNLIVSGDRAATWNVLIGGSNGPTPITCPTAFERIGARLLYGTECPLDDAWLGVGTLRDDLLGWREPLHRLQTPPMGNRMVQFVRHVGDGVVFAGTEGGLLKSTDGGLTYRFVIYHPLSGGTIYPYIQHLVQRGPLLVAGGFDKANDAGYLAYSTNSGESWVDVSHLVGAEHVVMLELDAAGRLLIGLYRDARFTLAE